MIKFCRKFLPFLLVLLFFCSCTDFFSTSWGKWAARDPSKLIPPVTIDNVYDLLDMATTPDLSLELLKKIGDAVEKSKGDEKAKLQAAAVEAAANSVGLLQTLAGATGALTNIDEDNAKDFAIKTINGMPNLDEASDALFKLLNSGDSDDFDNFIDNATAEEIALAAVLILAGEAKKNQDDMDKYIDEFFDDPSPQAELALLLAESLVDKGKVEDVPGPLRDILEGLNLW